MMDNKRLLALKAGKCSVLSHFYHIVTDCKAYTMFIRSRKCI